MPQLTFHRESHAQGGPRWAKRTRSPNPRAPPHARPRAPRLGLGAVRRLRRAKASQPVFWEWARIRTPYAAAAAAHSATPLARATRSCVRGVARARVAR